MIWLLAPPALAENPDLPPLPFTPVPDAPATTAGPVLELTGEGRASYDLVLYVRYDGNLYLDDMLVMESDLRPMVSERLAEDPSIRIVISADPRAPYEGILKVMDIARDSGAQRTALEVTGLDLDQAETSDDPLFPGTEEVTELGPTLTKEQLSDLKPKRHKFPQNPYGNTSSFTAYTLEFGETKIGPGSVNVGILPRVQVGTVPVLDVVTVFNVNAKANITREGPFDLALLAQYYFVPVTDILERIGVPLNIEDTEVTASASYLGVGAGTSLQVTDPWSLHAQLYWARPNARGQVSFDDLPPVLLGGLTLDLEGVGLGVTADLAVLNLATDVRFNRRDSVFAWLRYPFYGRARGQPEITDLFPEGTESPIPGDIDVIVAYGDFIPFSQTYSIAGGYQASWKHWEARIGVGWGGAATGVGGLPLAWLLQAFEVSYKFGGETRTTERKIRSGFRENRRDVKEGPPPPIPTEE